MSQNQDNQDLKLEIEPQLIDLVSDSEEEVEFLPIFGPFLAPYQGPSGRRLTIPHPLNFNTH